MLAECFNADCALIVLSRLFANRIRIWFLTSSKLLRRQDFDVAALDMPRAFIAIPQDPGHACLFAVTSRFYI